MSKRIILTALIVSAATVGGTWLVYRPLPQPTSQPAIAAVDDARSQQARALNQQLRSIPTATLVDPGPLPPSLQGSEHGIALSSDEQGNLRLQADMLQLFDFYLAGLEEEGLDKVLTRIHQELATQLKGPALEQARELLSRYVDYRIALQGLPETGMELDPTALRLRLDAINAVRQHYFSSEEYRVFFARENAESEYMLQRLMLARQDGLDDDARQQARAEMELQLTEEVRQARQESMRHGELYATTQALQARGASAEELHQVREQSLGREAADALAELDRQQAAWQQRLNDYARERNRLREAGLSQTDLQAAIADLQANRFDALERKRVQALDAEL
ncbi:lipase secretion chaperone [Pseudomonas sp. GOM6]|uniref:lipase secretion chaperone n=1 Tax=Pseudomonas sp. GOM6 TaxID=3036944 RepID=UPI0024097F20|nr:lipase secretion chaperone [Pseudomonas sp. GOM6]MDG1582666.1 lipase secretion chaperone [Pseudomonas sp. GOM6]